MKKTLFILLAGLSLNIMAQKVGEIPIEKIKAPYLKVHITPRGDIFKPYQNKIFVDYGQISKQSDIKKGFLYDKNGNEKKFNGIVDVLNFFCNYDWVLINSYPLGTGDEGDIDVFHYILKKKTKKSRSVNHFVY